MPSSPALAPGGAPAFPGCLRVEPVKRFLRNVGESRLQHPLGDWSVGRLPHAQDKRGAAGIFVRYPFSNALHRRRFGRPYLAYRRRLNSHVAIGKRSVWPPDLVVWSPLNDAQVDPLFAPDRNPIAPFGADAQGLDLTRFQLSDQLHLRLTPTIDIGELRPDPMTGV